MNELKNLQEVILLQEKEMWEITIDWETSNRYSLRTTEGEVIGHVAERKKGFLYTIIRQILRRNRPLTIDIWDKEQNLVLTGTRPFYFYFSDLKVEQRGRFIGEIKTRFGILKRRYDLLDSQGKVFAKIESYRWRLWTFDILDEQGNKVSEISKKWGGALKELFTDADKFLIQFSSHHWTQEQKQILLFACISIDLDFFESNSGSVIDLAG